MHADVSKDRLPIDFHSQGLDEEPPSLSPLFLLVDVNILDGDLANSD